MIILERERRVFAGNVSILMVMTIEALVTFSKYPLFPADVTAGSTPGFQRLKEHAALR